MDELFGNQLEENLKTTKTLEHSAKELSRTTPKVLNRLSKKLQRSIPSADQQTSVHDDGQTEEILQSATLGILKAGPVTPATNTPEGNFSKFGKKIGGALLVILTI